MRILYGTVLNVLLCVTLSYAQAPTTIPLTNQTPVRMTDANGVPVYPLDATSGAFKFTEVTCLSGESACIGTSPNSYIMVRQKATPSAVVTSDTLAITGAGFFNCIIVAPNDAAPTDGDIAIYDNTAESGTVLFKYHQTTAYFIPWQVCPGIPFATGLYIGFTTTADVNVQVTTGAP